MNKLDWSFLLILLVLIASFICILSFIIFLIQAFRDLYLKLDSFNSYMIVKSIDKNDKCFNQNKRKIYEV